MAKTKPEEELNPFDDENPFGDDEVQDESEESEESEETETEETEDKTPEPEAPKAKKTTAKPKATETRTRRTKEEILADSLAEATQLLSDNGFQVTVATENGEAPGEDGVSELEIVTYPVNSAKGDVVGEIGVNRSGILTVGVSLKYWVGEPGFVIQASAIDDVIHVLKDLRKQAITKKD